MDKRLSFLERRYDAYKAQAILDNDIANYEPQIESEPIDNEIPTKNILRLGE